MSTALVADAIVTGAPAPTPYSSSTALVADATATGAVAPTPYNSSSALLSDITVTEAPAPPTAPPEERVETAPPRRPWGLLAVLGLIGAVLVMTRRRKREEEERR
jgi:hypothetical protein